MGLYMGGRQIFETSHEVHIREEDNKFNRTPAIRVFVGIFY
jgi:hypothetical protein